jgi:phosphate transport system permease protein
MALICGAILLLIVIFLTWKAFPIFSEIGLVKFFTDRSWHPTAGEYNFIPMLLGTILTSLGAILVATPTGVISAIFTHYYAPIAIALIYRRSRSR